MPSRTPLESWVAGKIGCNGTKLTRQKIAEYQLRKLNEVICWARTRSPFYARQLHGLPEGDLGSLDDLCQLPFTNADDLREHALQFLCVSQGEIDRIVTLESSGTAGNPKRVFFTAEDQELTLDFFQVGMSSFVKSGDSVLIALPGERRGSVGGLLATALRRLGTRPSVCGLVSDPATTMQIIAREQVECIVGLPVQILSLVRYRGRYAGFPSRNLNSVLLCSDHVPRSIVREIQQSWECRVFEHYGMTEMGLGGGVDCGAHSGYHLREADLYFEVVDVKTRKPVVLGDSGEIVFTTLTRRGMPLIRYRTGDVSRFLLEPCECGTMLWRLDRVRSRTNGAVTLAANGKITMAALDEALFALPRLRDFTATLVHGSPSTLVVTAAGPQHRDCLQQSVRDALELVPAIQAAEESGELNLVVKIADGKLPACNGKRRIVEVAS